MTFRCKSLYIPLVYILYTYPLCMSYVYILMCIFFLCISPLYKLIRIYTNLCIYTSLCISLFMSLSISLYIHQSVYKSHIYVLCMYVSWVNIVLYVCFHIYVSPCVRLSVYMFLCVGHFVYSLYIFFIYIQVICLLSISPMYILCIFYLSISRVYVNLCKSARAYIFVCTLINHKAHLYLRLALKFSCVFETGAEI